MKRLGFAMLVFVLSASLCLSGCSFGESPKTSATNILEALKNYDTAAMSQYSVNEVTAETENAEQLQAIFSRMSYVIGDVVKTGDTAAVSVQITTVDMNAVLTDYMSYVLENMLSDLDEAALNDKFTELVSSSEATKTFDTTMNLTKGDGRWMYETDDADANADFVNAVTGGLSDIADSLNSAVSDTE